MIPVGLRLNLTPDVLARLVSAVADKFKHFVRVNRTQHARPFYEVDLRILGAYDAKDPKAGEGIHPTENVIVTREMVGELFDLLGIFPRESKTKSVDPKAYQALLDIDSRVANLIELFYSVELGTKRDFVSILLGAIRKNVQEVEKHLFEK